jgi:serine O-acetyltransferase
MNTLRAVIKTRVWDSILNIVQEWQQDVSCVFSRDPAARHHVEVLLTYPGVHAVMLHRVSHRLWCHHWRFSARLLAYLGRGISNVDIHPGACIGRRLFIDHGAGVVIGETAALGDDVTLYHGVTLGGVSMHKGKRHPTLGNGVLVGAGAKILGAIDIGDHVRIGANAVVVENVPMHSTVVGIPAKVIRHHLHPYQAQQILNSTQLQIQDSVSEALTQIHARLDALERDLVFIKQAPNALNPSMSLIPYQNTGQHWQQCPLRLTREPRRHMESSD